MENSRVFNLSLDELRARKSLKWQVYPPDVLPAWVAEMDCLPAPAVTERLSAALATGDTGYPYAEEYQQALARYAADYWDWSFDPAADAVLVPDVMQGIAAVLRQCTQPGDAVAINPPVYHQFAAFLNWAERRIVNVALTPEGRLDLDALERCFSGADGVKPAAYLLCSPHNPHGTVHSRAELSRVAELARAHGVRVLSDEIHAPLVGQAAVHVPYLSVPNTEDAVVITSASKSWNLAGLKAGLAIAGAQARDVVHALPAPVTHSASHLGILSHSAALEHGRDWLAQAVTEIEQNKRLFGELLAERLPEVGYRPGPATYLVWLDCTGLGLADPAAEFLERGRVAFNAGPSFGPGGEQHVRANLATSPELVTEMVARMARTVGR